MTDTADPFADAPARAAAAPTPGGLTPYVGVPDADAASAFYQKAFGAVEALRMPAQDGKRLMHCHLLVNGAHLFINDPFPEYGHPFVQPQGFALHLVVDHAQPWWDRAIAAGCEISAPLKKEFWGDYFGQLKDPFGIMWSLTSKAL